MDLCELAKHDARRHIGDPRNDSHRDDAEAIAKRNGLSVELVHHALDTGRGYAHLYAVAVPYWHELGDAARAQQMDGVKLLAGDREQPARQAVDEQQRRAVRVYVWRNRSH